MHVAISVGGRFHAFNLAAELERRGCLSQLITSYPSSVATRFGVPREKVSSLVWKEVLERGWGKLPTVLKAAWNPQYALSVAFDRAAARRIRSADIVVGWANQSLETLRRAHSLGARTVVERGSSHIVAQSELLREEYDRNGLQPLPFQVAHPRIIARELQEYEEADRISVPSSFVARTFRERGIPASKLIHVPYGVDLSQFRQVPKIDNVFRVVFAGGMTFRKGVHYLLQAFAELKLPNAELLLIGAMNDEMKPFFTKYEGRYRYLGKFPQADLHHYYSQSSVFAMASIEEGLAMVIPQAMACGLPIIATTNTGAEDIVRDGVDGFIISIRDVGVLKEKIMYLYEHPEIRDRMGESAKQRVASGFTWEDYGRRIMEAYTTLVRTSPHD